MKTSSSVDVGVVALNCCRTKKNESKVDFIVENFIQRLGLFGVYVSAIIAKSKAKHFLLLLLLFYM
jgi:hypothetical protein